MGARRSPRFTELPRAGGRRISPYVLRLSAQMLVPIQIDNQNSWCVSETRRRTRSGWASVYR